MTQQLRRGIPAPRDGDIERRLAGVVRRAWVSARVDERPNSLFAASLPGPVKGRLAQLRFRVDLRAQGKQAL